MNKMPELDPEQIVVIIRRYGDPTRKRIEAAQAIAQAQRELLEEWVKLPEGSSELAIWLKQLVQEHKRECNDENCPISTMRLGKLYEFLIGRKLTGEEMVIFM